MCVKRNDVSQQWENELSTGYRVSLPWRHGDTGQHVPLPMRKSYLQIVTRDIKPPVQHQTQHTGYTFLLPYGTPCTIIALYLHYLCLDIREFQFLH